MRWKSRRGGSRVAEAGRCFTESRVTCAFLSITHQRLANTIEIEFLGRKLRKGIKVLVCKTGTAALNQALN